MSVGPVVLNGMIQRTQDIGNLKQQEDTRLPRATFAAVPARVSRSCGSVVPSAAGPRPCGRWARAHPPARPRPSPPPRAGALGSSAPPPLLAVLRGRPCACAGLSSAGPPRGLVLLSRFSLRCGFVVPVWGCPGAARPPRTCRPSVARRCVVRPARVGGALACWGWRRSWRRRVLEVRSQGGLERPRTSVKVASGHYPRRFHVARARADGR